jgi:amino acid transporter
MEKSADVEAASTPSETKYASDDQTEAPIDTRMGELVAVDQVKLKQKFSIWSTLGVSYSVTSSPIAIATYLSVVVGVGGSPVFFFSYIVTSIFGLTICFCLAEMSAIFPHSSGQIFWTATLAPTKYARGTSYLIGWWTSAGWFMWVCACCLITSQLLWALVAICHETFVALPWHFYLVYLAAGLFSLAINWPFFSIYPLFLKGLVVFINVGTLFVMISLLVRAHPKQSAKYVFLDIVNYTGWKSDGVVFFLGLLPGLTAVTAFDSAAHMAEEMPRPHRQVPQVMVGSAVLSAAGGFVMILVYMFCVTNNDALLDPVGAEPIAQLLLDSLDSMALTIIAMLIFILVMLFACATLMTAFSRVWWSFAREGGVPFSKIQASVSQKSHLPVSALIFSFLASTLIGLIELGSATALNAILGAGTVFLFLSYSGPLVASVTSRRKAFREPHYFDLGHRVGMVLSVISILWIFFITVWLCMPSYLPVTGDYMNYTVAVLVVVNAIAGINWVCHSRKTFTVPAPVMLQGELLTSVQE